MKKLLNKTMTSLAALSTMALTANASAATDLNAKATAIGTQMFSATNVGLVEKALLMAGLAVMVVGGYKWFSTQSFGDAKKPILTGVALALVGMSFEVIVEQITGLTIG